MIIKPVSELPDRTPILLPVIADPTLLWDTCGDSCCSITYCSNYDGTLMHEKLLVPTWWPATYQCAPIDFARAAIDELTKVHISFIPGFTVYREGADQESLELFVDHNAEAAYLDYDSLETIEFPPGTDPYVIVASQNDRHVTSLVWSDVRQAYKLLLEAKTVPDRRAELPLVLKKLLNLKLNANRETGD